MQSKYFPFPVENINGYLVRTGWSIIYPEMLHSSWVRAKKVLEICYSMHPLLFAFTFLPILHYSLCALEIDRFIID